MSKIELRNITHIYESGGEKTQAVKDVNLTLEEGTSNALIGPSGCGKTTLLNIISGLLTPTEGKVLIDGEDVTELPPQDRDVAQVFQFPVVYDSMDVYGNLAFPLRNRDVPKEEIKERVQETAELLGLVDKLHDNPGNFGPEWSQLVSLGRGIIRHDTTALLFDEPMTDVDPGRKLTLRRRISQAQQRLKVTSLYVTHDQHEALTFADKAAVMNQGQIVQYGSPEKLYEQPVSTFVGNFIGSPGMNFIDCVATDSKLKVGSFEIPISDEIKDLLDPSWTSLQVGIRPYQIDIADEQREDKPISTTVTLTEHLGSYRIITLKLPEIDKEIKAEVPLDEQVEVGDEKFIGLNQENIRLFHEGQAIENGGE
ncbi:MAG: ABC transporter ATP-binding protein [Candidatus Bipolaricaulota bacterium]|nr:ABC transporter ATP-binding protein [Candidatus Bipolaricaulota bacterium]MBS3792035.1 ABC transporter ATP-binding protein [Candidatus Bipolaricaulota bacterium]